MTVEQLITLLKMRDPNEVVYVEQERHDICRNVDVITVSGLGTRTCLVPYDERVRPHTLIDPDTVEEDDNVVELLVLR